MKTFTITPEVIQQFDDLSYSFIFSESVNYRDIAESDKMKNTIIENVCHNFPSEEQIFSHSYNIYYAEFYKKMGLKIKSVSTPIKQANRVREILSYKCILPNIDKAMLIEYKTLLSFQVFDAELIGNNLTISISNGTELIETFHGEIKACKLGEVLLSNDNDVIHSSYYGINKKYALTNDSKYSLTRIMKIPSIPNSEFTQAIENYMLITNATHHVVLNKSISQKSL